MVDFPRLPNKKYQVILADPPWAYRNWSDKKHGAARSWYDCLGTQEIASLPVWTITDDNCTLFLWITGPKLVEGAHLRIMSGWGFRPVNVAFVWNKTNRDGTPYMGLGFSTRSSTEFVIRGVKGSPARLGKAVRQSFAYPRGRHSQKPPLVQNRIVELLGDVPRIELFGRGLPLPGWDIWGLEAVELESL